MKILEKPFFMLPKSFKSMFLGGSAVSNWWKFSKLLSDLLWHNWIQIQKKISGGEVSYRSLAWLNLFFWRPTYMLLFFLGGSYKRKNIQNELFYAF